MDETPTANVETQASEPVAQQPSVAAPPPNAANPQGVTPAGTDLRKLNRTIEIVKGDPEGQKILAAELGFITAEQVNQQRLQDARELAVEAFGIPADKQKFVVGATPAEIRQSAKELAELLKPAATPADGATEPTSQPAATKVELPTRVAETPVITNKTDAVNAYAEWAEKNIGK